MRTFTKEQATEYLSKTGQTQKDIEKWRKALSAEHRLLCYRLDDNEDLQDYATAILKALTGKRLLVREYVVIRKPR